MAAKVSRRRFFKVAGATALTATVAGPSLWVRRASAQRKTVSMLVNSHFVPQFDQELQRQVGEWGKLKGVDTRIDPIAEREISAKLATEAETRTGHDVVILRWMEPTVYPSSLVPMDDLAQELDRSLGPWSETAKYLWHIRGRWLALPWRYDSAPVTINTDHWRKIGLDADAVGNMTWDGFIDAAAKLHAQGTPGGAAISEAYKSQHLCFPLMWGYGAKATDDKGTISINSRETAEAIEVARRLYKFMPPDVLTWDETVNNRGMMAGNLSWTINAPSILAVAKRDKLPTADKLDLAPMPAGPVGRFRSASSYSLGIWNFSPNIDEAKDLLRFLVQKENFLKQAEASGGYNQPFLPGHRGAPIYKRERQLRNYEPPKENVQAWGWPAPSSPATQISMGLFVIPNMFAKALSGELTTQKAMEWAERQLTRIYRG